MASLANVLKVSTDSVGYVGHFEGNLDCKTM